MGWRGLAQRHAIQLDPGMRVEIIALAFSHTHAQHGRQSLPPRRLLDDQRLPQATAGVTTLPADDEEALAEE